MEESKAHAEELKQAQRKRDRELAASKKRGLEDLVVSGRWCRPSATKKQMGKAYTGQRPPKCETGGESAGRSAPVRSQLKLQRVHGTATAPMFFCFSFPFLTAFSLPPASPV